ncbi:LemA family protein [Limihaloglobus sulfuriphilus]|uniref:LemA family protein n=1 Tax=Limihaloglobus sulfuriphilus TaxID=1851148 RepID=A0A1Q2MBW0_9BACT|nr:LemA family protein [Limihaloglobus sulfuriphilus]AQQ70215.1 LemA family protein [Limihaloglobus sulfuriphilus]
MVPLYIGIGIAVFLLIVFILIRNSLVGKKNEVERVFSTIDVMLKKRYDLIPNLVATVKQYMTHEKELLTDVTRLRASAMKGGMSSDERVNLDNMISKTLGGIMVAVENYPQLKANENFMHLQASLNEIEEQISAARRAFNSAVTDYNNAVEMFPTNVVAGMMNYTRKQVFETSELERQNPNIGGLFAKEN